MVQRVTPRTPRLTAHPLKTFERGALSTALAKSNLPTDGIEAPDHLFWRFDTADGMPVGFGGLEIHDADALMRSIVILPPLRGRGIGAAIVSLLEGEAARYGCRAIWLLTTTASEFFTQLGYARCDRAVVPEKIRTTREFAALCPQSAEVLLKRFA